VQALCRRTDCTGLAAEHGAGPHEAGEASRGPRIEVSVDALFG
jgi:hypothetical protein